MQVYIDSILRRPAEDTVNISSRLWPKIVPVGSIFEPLEVCKRYSVRGKGSKIESIYGGIHSIA